MYARGKPDGEDAPQHRRVDMEVAPSQLIDLLRRGQHVQNQDCRDELRNNGGEGNALDAGLEHQDKDEVKDDVQDAGEHQKKQRESGVADGSQDAASDVIDQKSGYPQEEYGQVQGRVVEDIVRGGHEAEHGTDAGYAYDSEDYAENECRHHGGADRDMKLIDLACSKML